MWIKPTIRHLFAPIKVAQIQNTNNKMQYNRKYHPLLVSMQNGTATLEGHMAVS